MKKDAIINQLEHFGYRYNTDGQILTVKLGFALRVSIDFSKPDKVVVTEHLKAWNFLTGIIEMRLRGALIYNTIGFVVVALLFFWFSSFTDPTLLILIYILMVGLVLLWSLFYLVKAESFKQQVRAWAGEESPEKS